MTNYTPRLREAPPRGILAHLGSIVIWILWDFISYHVCQISYHNRQTSYQLLTNIWEENDGQCLHDIPYNTCTKRWAPRVPQHTRGASTRKAQRYKDHILHAPAQLRLPRSHARHETKTNTKRSRSSGYGGRTSRTISLNFRYIYIYIYMAVSILFL